MKHKFEFYMGLAPVCLARKAQLCLENEDAGPPQTKAGPSWEENLFNKKKGPSSVILVDWIIFMSSEKVCNPYLCTFLT